MRSKQRFGFGRSAASWAAGLALLSAAAAPALALDDKAQVLSGGTSMTEGSTHFTAPGLANVFGADFPGPGKGNRAAQIRMPAGVLKNLRVKVTTQNTPSSGNLTVMVRVNGSNTVLTCQVSGTGNCHTGGAPSVTIANNDRLSVRIVNNFVDSGVMVYTYTLIFD